MNLASRCSACGTLFRIVPDQLKIAEGWARCGRCGEVFNAVEGLYDLSRGRPPAWAPTGGGEAGPDGAAHAEDAGEEALAALEADEAAVDAQGDVGAPKADAAVPRTEVLEDTSQLDAYEADGALAAQADEGAAQTEPSDALTPRAFETFIAAPAASAEAPHRSTPAWNPATDPAPGRFATAADDDALADLDAALGLRDADADTAAASLTARASASADEPVDLPPPIEHYGLEAAVPPAGAAPSPTPDFVRRAEREARWSRRPVRIALAIASAMLLAALLAQTALHFRDELAARSPLAERLLASACSALGCRVEAPRRIADVAVESSSLSRVGGEAELVRLSLTLRNRGDAVVAMPSVDLVLTDAAGAVLARRALGPAELGAAQPLPPRVDVPLQAVLAVRGQRVAGYTLELFYP